MILAGNWMAISIGIITSLWMDVVPSGIGGTLVWRYHLSTFLSVPPNTFFICANVRQHQLMLPGQLCMVERHL